MTRINYSHNVFISVKNAVQLYGLSQEDVKQMNTNGDDKITIDEFKSFGIGSNSGLASYFNNATGGLFFMAENPTQAFNNKTRPIMKTQGVAKTEANNFFDYKQKKKLNYFA